jgi:hypothetical protein
MSADADEKAALRRRKTQQRRSRAESAEFISSQIALSDRKKRKEEMLSRMPGDFAEDIAFIRVVAQQGPISS